MCKHVIILILQDLGRKTFATELFIVCQVIRTGTVLMTYILRAYMIPNQKICFM
jgi:hypothetical protein